MGNASWEILLLVLGVGEQHLFEGWEQVLGLA